MKELLMLAGQIALAVIAIVLAQMMGEKHALAKVLTPVVKDLVKALL